MSRAGFRGQISRSTLADANLAHDWRIVADLAQALYSHSPVGVTLDQTVDTLDSTTIALCGSLFRRASFRRRTAAVKLHTLIDLRGNIPTFIPLTHGTTPDVNVSDVLPIEAAAFDVRDRGHVDFARLRRVTDCDPDTQR